MSKNKDKKKGEGDLEKEMKVMLSLDIEVLENRIFIEQQKEQESLFELERINKQLVDDQRIIEHSRIEEGRRVNNDNDSLKQQVIKYSTEISELENQNSNYDRDLRILEETILETEAAYQKQLVEKENSISEMRRQFEDMSVRFQHILQRTANKLQERINAGV